MYVYKCIPWIYISSFTLPLTNLLLRLLLCLIFLSLSLALSISCSSCTLMSNPAYNQMWPRDGDIHQKVDETAISTPFRSRPSLQFSLSISLSQSLSISLIPLLLLLSGRFCPQSIHAIDFDCSWS